MALPLIAMAALTGAKYLADKGREDRQRKVQSETTRYSPWTGLKGQAPEEADLVGTALEGYGNYEMGQQAEADRSAGDELRKAQLKWLDKASGGGQPETGLQDPSLQNLMGNPNSWSALRSQNRWA